MNINCTDNCFYQKDGKCTLDKLSNNMRSNSNYRLEPHAPDVQSNCPHNVI